MACRRAPWSGISSACASRRQALVGRPLRIATPGNLEAVADFVAACVRETLAIEADVIVVPADQLTGGARMLIEKKLVPPWDVLMHAWFDLSSDLPL